jgi:hypothetical protein
MSSQPSYCSEWVWAVQPEFNFQQEQRFYSLSLNPDQFWDPPNQDLNMITHFHPEQRQKVCGVTPQLFHISLWYDVG